jgi:hypothetical protein
MSFLNPAMLLPKPLALTPATTNTLIPPFPLWLYKYLAAFPITGLLGMDHFAIGSNFTGLMKLAVNLLTLGSWYAFDVVQVYNAQNIRDKGLQYPFFDFGEIGKGKIDDEPMNIMSKNTQLWIYIIFVCLFAGLYYISSLFLSASNKLVPTLIRYFSKFTFYAALALACYTAFIFLTNKTSNIINTITPTSQSGALSTLFNQAGVRNPALGVAPSSSVLKALSSSSLASTFGKMFGGGEIYNDLNELKEIAKKVQNGGSKESFTHIYFMLILLLIPISGLTIYTLRKYNKPTKKDEISGNTRTI